MLPRSPRLESRVGRALVALVAASTVLAGCVTSEVEPREDAKKPKLVNLATLVPGAEAGDAAPAYYYWSGLLEGSWAAFRFDIPREAVVTPATGSPYAKVHVVTAVLENGEVVEGDPGRGSGVPASDGVLAVIGYVVAPSGEAFEGIGRVNASFAAEYSNWSIKGIAGNPVQNDTVLVVGGLPPVERPGPLHVAMIVRIGGPEPARVKHGSMWEEATRELASGREAHALRPLAQGGGFGASVYRETPAIPGMRDASQSSRDVVVEDRSSGPQVPGMAAQRVLSLSARREIESPSRVILAATQSAATALGAFNWTYVSASGETFEGDHGFGNGIVGGAPPLAAALLNEGAGSLAFDLTLRTTAGAQVAPVLVLVTLGIDVPTVYGRPVLGFTPRSGSSLPGPVDDALKAIAPP